MGLAVMVTALVQMHWAFDPVRIAVFLVTFVCGTAIAYSFMLLLTALSVWMVRNQSLMEMWWLFSSLARYPKEIMRTSERWFGMQYPLSHFAEMPRGGHFAPFEEPELYAEELRAFFRPYRRAAS